MTLIEWPRLNDTDRMAEAARASRATRKRPPQHDRSRRAEPEAEFEPRGRLARRGIAVDAPLVRRVDVSSSVLRAHAKAALGSSAALPVAIQSRRVGADKPATAACEYVRAGLKPPIEANRKLTGPRVVDVRVLHDTVV